jgi:uncharacterized surface protein with fasciclin (FAS1) repeats
MHASRRLLLGLSLTVCLVMATAACQSSDRTLPVAEVDSSNTLSKDLLRHLATRARLDTFRNALRRTGLIQRLDHAGPFTIFAPTNKAFANAPASFDTLYFGGSPDSLLTYHVAHGRYDQERVADSLRIGTLSADPLVLRRDTTAPGGLRVQGRAPHQKIPARNGVLYVLPALLRPPIDTTEAA